MVIWTWARSPEWLNVFPVRKASLTGSMGMLGGPLSGGLLPGPLSGGFLAGGSAVVESRCGGTEVGVFGVGGFGVGDGEVGGGLLSG